MAAWGVAEAVAALTSTIHLSGLVDGAGKAGGGPRLRLVGKEGEGGCRQAWRLGGWHRWWLPLPLPYIRLGWLMVLERLGAGRGYGLRARRVRVCGVG